MKTILSRKDLQHQTEHWVMVAREDSIYVRVGDEYVKKRYFTPAEAKSILDSNRSRVYELIGKLGIHPASKRGQTIRITLKELRQMIELQTKTEAP